MLLFNKNIDEDYRFVEEALAAGVISEARLDEAVTRIIATKMAQGLYKDTTAVGTPGGLEAIDAKQAQHQEQVELIAKNAVTLVKDREHLLPVTPERYPRIRLVVLGDSSDGGFKEGGQVTEGFVKGLADLGFTVSVYDRSRLDFHEIFEEGVADLQEKFDLALYVANVETASNQTTTRLDWIHLMAADAPWFLRSLPTVFVSTANPYHLFDLPSVSTFINAYTGNPATIAAILRKLTGQEAFSGKSPVDPFCGDLLAKY